MRTPPQIISPRSTGATLHPRPWGGHRLGALRGDSRGEPIGESWEFSTLAQSESATQDGPLSSVLGRPLPFLAKLIDTAQPLSVQVHPGDDPEADNSGKEEAWVILDADPDAHVLAGLRDGVTPTAFERRARHAAADPTQGEAFIDLLERIPVEPGSVILVPAGTVHAIGGGVFLAEIQQPCDTTYRLFDYGRERPIHTDHAIAATDPRARAQVWRSGDAPTLLRGRHLDLDILGPGQHARADLDSDTLLIPVLGHCELESGSSAHPLGPGELRLCTRGPIRVAVGDEGLAVLGSLPRPFAAKTSP